jgi:hypothetical protein
MSTDLERVMHRDDPMYDPGGQPQPAAPARGTSSKLEAFAGDVEAEQQQEAAAAATEPEPAPSADDTQDAEVVDDTDTAAAVDQAEGDLVGDPPAQPKQHNKAANKQQKAAQDPGAPYTLTTLDLNQHQYDRQAAFEADLVAALKAAPDSDQAADLWQANQEEVQRLQQHAPNKAHAIWQAYQQTQPAEADS